MFRTIFGLFPITSVLRMLEIFTPFKEWKGNSNYMLLHYQKGGFLKIKKSNIYSKNIVEKHVQIQVFDKMMA